MEKNSRGLANYNLKMIVSKWLLCRDKSATNTIKIMITSRRPTNTDRKFKFQSKNRKKLRLFKKIC
jgi:hypothetical protein